MGVSKEEGGQGELRGEVCGVCGDVCLEEWEAVGVALSDLVG